MGGVQGRDKSSELLSVWPVGPVVGECQSNLRLRYPCSPPSLPLTHFLVRTLCECVKTSHHPPSVLVVPAVAQGTTCEPGLAQC